MLYGTPHTPCRRAGRGYTISEVDAVTGPALGRPRSATFRTADLVGLDTFWQVAQNSLAALPGDAIQQVIPAPNFPAAMVDHGWLGNKTGQGFYKQVRSETGCAFYKLDYQTME